MMREKVTSKFIKNVSELMTAQHVTQMELSQRTGITQGALSKYLMGHREPTLTPAYLIAQALNVKLDDLLK